MRLLSTSAYVVGYRDAVLPDVEGPHRYPAVFLIRGARFLKVGDKISQASVLLRVGEVVLLESDDSRGQRFRPPIPTDSRVNTAKS